MLLIKRGLRLPRIQFNGNSKGIITQEENWYLGKMPLVRASSCFDFKKYGVFWLWEFEMLQGGFIDKRFYFKSYRRALQHFANQFCEPVVFGRTDSKQTIRFKMINFEDRVEFKLGKIWFCSVYRHSIDAEFYTIYGGYPLAPLPDFKHELDKAKRFVQEQIADELTKVEFFEA